MTDETKDSLVDPEAALSTDNYSDIVMSPRSAFFASTQRQERSRGPFESIDIDDGEDGLKTLTSTRMRIRRKSKLADACFPLKEDVPLTQSCNFSKTVSAMKSGITGGDAGGGGRSNPLLSNHNTNFTGGKRPPLLSQATLNGGLTLGQAWKPLTNMEKKYLIAVERGDLGSVRRFLETPMSPEFNVNCCDPIGRSALLMAIDNENLEMIELLISYGVEMKDALLHAINEEFVEAVELLLDHEESVHLPGQPYSWEAVERETFTSDVTPLILAAHKNNYEIIKLILDRGISPIPSPHDARCGCKTCRQSRVEDHLRHSRSRINAYRALASPSLIALSSKDPILTAFELSWQLRRLSFLEPEFKTEYLELRKQCQLFATALLDHTRTTHELEVLLNHDPGVDSLDSHGKMTLSRLKLAIRCKQKKFCAHANVQQLLASIWYEGLPGFRRKNIVVQTLQIIFIGFLFPFFSIAYIIAPCTRIGQVMKKPFIKFICHSASYMTFLVLLALASQRIETDIFDFEVKDKDGQQESATKRGAPPTLIELMVLPWVLGLIWSEIKQLWELGLADYLSDMWNILDFITNSLYVATITLRVIAYLQVQKEISQNTGTAHLSRESWDAFDPILLAEGLFAAANIFSSLKLVYIFSVNPHLGPLQISLGRMVIDILKFFSVYTLVCFAFACGMNQLLWYYADMERQVCIVQSKSLQNGSWTYAYQPNTQMPSVSGPIISSGGRRMFMPKSANEACIAYRKFSNLFESLQTLFWATFGLIDLENFELTGIQSYTRFWGMTMFGCYCIINVTVLLNLLIAMMNHSYQIISEQADTEWKFARTKLWMSYFEDGGTVPIPFNIIPTPKSFVYLFQWFFKKFFSRTKFARNEAMKTIRRKARQASERDHRYQTVMRSLVRRYITNEQRTAERQRGVTEDDCNEIKQDISALRFELIEILGGRLLNASIPVEPPGSGSLTLLGKRGRKRERRLIKGFDFNFMFAETMTSFDDPDAGSPPAIPEATKVGPDGKAIKSPPSTTRNKFVRLARGLAGKRVVRANRWKQLIEATRSKVIPFSRSSESVNSVGNPRSPTAASAAKPTDTQQDDEWKTQEETETEEAQASKGNPVKSQVSLEGQPAKERRHSQIHDFDLSTKRSIFARKVTTLIRDAPDLVSSKDVVLQDREPPTFNKCHPPGVKREAEKKKYELSAKEMDKEDNASQPGSSYESRKRGSSSPEVTSSCPRLMVTLPVPTEKEDSQESNDANPSGGTEEMPEEQLRVIKKTRRRSKTHGSRSHHHHHHHRSHVMSRSRSPSKSPSPQSLNASVLIGLTQQKSPKNEWI